MVGVHLTDIVGEAPSLIADTSQRKTEDQGKQHNANHIVPIKQFIAPVFGGQFLCVAPRSPAKHGDQAEQYC